MQEKRGKLKKTLLSKKEPELKDVGNSQPSFIAKNEKAYSGQNIKDVPG